MTSLAIGPAQQIALPFDWLAAQDAILRWAKQSGLIAVWSRYNAPRPANPFIALKITQAPSPVAYDCRQYTYDSTVDAFQVNVAGQREFVCNVQAFIQVDSPDASMEGSGIFGQWADAAGYLALLSSALRAPGTIDDLASADVSVIDITPIIVLDDIALGEFDSRASMDVRFRIASNLIIAPTPQGIVPILSTQITGNTSGITEGITVP